VRIVELGRSSLRMAYRIERAGQATAEGETVLVCFDYASRRPRRLDAEFVSCVQDFERGGPPSPIA
jgi:acyl-CoA thioesterase FadM